MPSQLLDAADQGVDATVAAFEDAWMSAPRPDLHDFLPQRTHPLFATILCELVRVDLELGWARGQAHAIDHYVRRYPEVFAERAHLAAITYEEFRLRKQAGQRPDLADYVRRYGVEPAPSQELPQTRLVPEQIAVPTTPADPHVLDVLRRYEPQLAAEMADGLERMPKVGEEFEGFRLCRELGRGAFGRVFLAEQRLLAHRPVALKIGSAGAQESQTLAQLQHTHIVPIYSLHQRGPLYAVCMPFFGATTLADVLRELASRPTLPHTGAELFSTVNERAHAKTMRALSDLTPASSEPAPPVEPATARSPLPLAGMMLQFQGRTYVEAVLWLGRCLADGLAHAHERGIIHRDLKPANVLLTDDGQPMLLDFNLSDNARLRDSPSAAMLGGTLPYMAPEHLDAFRGGPRQVDARSDLYSLGILLFELLTGRSPFERGLSGKESGVGPHELVAAMIVERRQGAPAARRLNPAISPAADAILRRCLDPDPARRYQTARQLQDDLQRQLDHLPLLHAREPSRRERAQKWLRRHPRFLGRAAWTLAAMLLIAATVGGWQALRHARAEEAWSNLGGFRTDIEAARSLLITQADDPEQRARGMQLGLAGLGRYRVLTDAGWDERRPLCDLPSAEQTRLRAEIGDALLLLARAKAWPVAHASGQAPDRSAPLRDALALNEQAERCFAAATAPPALWLQRADLLRQLGDAPAAGKSAQQAASAAPQSAHDYFLLAREHLSAGRHLQAQKLLRRASELDPRHYWTWFHLGNCSDELGDDVRATVCYSMCLALDERAFEAWFNRGLANLRQKEFAAAQADFDRAAQLRPELPDVYLNRSLAHQGLGQHRAAVDDLTCALEKEGAPTRLYFMRSRARARAGDKEGAQHDRAEGLRQTPADEKSWVARGLARLNADAEGALADFEQALQLNPRSRAALQNKAHALAEKLGRTDEALRVLDQAIEQYPDYLPAQVGRGVLRARLGQVAAAHQDAERVLQRQPTGMIRYQVACIFALTSTKSPGDSKQAFALLTEALRQGFGMELLSQDTDLDPLRQLPEFQNLAGAAVAWQTALRIGR